MSWQPRWKLPPEPIRDDEEQVKDLYFKTIGPRDLIPWERLQEWQKESWRREYRGQ